MRRQASRRCASAGDFKDAGRGPARESPRINRLAAALCVCVTHTHIIEPKYWGAVERIVDISACMDADALFREAPGVIEATQANAALHARTRKFIGAAASLLGDTCRMAIEYTDTDKIMRTAARIAVREFGPRAEESGRLTRYFLSAVTPQGLVTFHDTLLAMCPRIYSVEDEYGASSRLLLGELCRRALEAGQYTISCSDPLFPNEGPEHVIVPALGVGFTTSNQWHKADFPVYRRIHAARFTDTEALRNKKPLMSFNRRAARELLNEAVLISQEAKKVHDRLEEYYVAGMDWDAVNKLTARVVEAFDAIADEAELAE